jgi:hypothetical protein
VKVPFCFGLALAVLIVSCGGDHKTRARSIDNAASCEIGLATDSGGSTILSKRVRIVLPQGGEYVVFNAGITTGQSWLKICILADSSTLEISDDDCRERSRQAKSPPGSRLLDEIAAACRVIHE